MTSIRREVLIDVPPDDVRNALHTRLVTGFVTDCRLEGDARTVTLANGVVARELIVDVNEGERRVLWALVSGRPTHHNASVRAFDEGPGKGRVAGLADLLPNKTAPAIATIIELGTRAMKATLERAAPAA